MKGRLSAPKWICLDCDPALSGVDNEVKLDYLFRRDLSLLPVDTAKRVNTKTGEPVAMLKLKPLTRAECAQIEVSEIMAKTEMVRTHVTEVHNYEGLRVEQDQKAGYACLTNDSMEAMDEKAIDEVYAVLRELAAGADGEYRPFSLPDGWRADRSRSLQLPAVRALQDAIAKASDSTDQSSSEKSSADSDRE